jgi:hypothetical protein
MIALTPVDVALLDALATYRLLTIPQAMRLGIAKRDYVGDRLRALAAQHLIGVLEQGRMKGPKLHWLTPSGMKLAAELAADRGEPLASTASPRRFALSAHLPQRLAIVDCHIAARMWARANGAAVEWFRVEFEPNPKGELRKALQYPWEWNGQAVTYDPDAVGVVRLTDGEKFLFALEVETGGEARSIGNFQKRLAGRLGAFAARAIETGTDWPKGLPVSRLLFTFPDDKTMHKAQLWAVRHYADTMRFVFFSTVPRLQADFAGGWQNVRGETALPFARNRKG